MKFYIAEKNIGPGATHEDAEELIRRLKARGWDVAYGQQENQVTDPAEINKKQDITDRFADDFMACLNEMEK